MVGKWPPVPSSSLPPTLKVGGGLKTFKEMRCARKKPGQWQCIKGVFKVMMRVGHVFSLVLPLGAKFHQNVKNQNFVKFSLF
jgi:hypothetical protein